MKEKTDLIYENLNFNNYDNVNIADMIEFSYYIATNKDLDILNEIIREYAMDGIITYAVFVKFCYEYYMTEGADKYWSLWEMADDCFSDLVNKFIEKYYIKEVK